MQRYLDQQLSWQTFRSILKNRLLNFRHKHKIVYCFQIGIFSRNRSSDHIFTLKTLIDKHVTHTPKGKLNTRVVNFKKAFNLFWHHQGILDKLLKYNTGGTFYETITSMYLRAIKMLC